MSKIHTLTPEQEAEIPVFRQRYLDIACGGGRIDRQALEEALADAYAVIGKPAPKLHIFDSPAACMLAVKTLQIREESQLYGQLFDQFCGQFHRQFEQLTIQIERQLEDQLWSQLWDPLCNQIGEQLWKLLYNQLYDQSWNISHLGGSQGLGEIAWARFVQKIGVVLEPETAARLDIAERLATQCEWWWPDEEAVVASERPTAVRWDDQRRLHCENGPAVEYADGLSLYSWHGTAVPKEWIVGEKPTPQQALTWENIEQRRAACEILGWANILDALDARIIDQHDNLEIGELIEVTLPDIGKERFLKVRCPTGRTFAIPVPPDMTTALQANAWTYGFDEPGEYRLELRT